jgi:hypothetical protein
LAASLNFMDHLKLIRNESILSAKRLGVDVSPTLPLLDAGLEMRSTDESVSRILAMNAVAAAAYGFDKAKAIAWLDQEMLIDSLTGPEKRFIFEETVQTERFKVQVEGMWAIAWATGIVSDMNFGKDCDSRFAAMLPNLKVSQSSGAFRKKASPRPLEQVIAACDLAYCLHWAIRQSEISDKYPLGNLKPYVVIERRRALEWLLSKESWDEVPLDT